jgi:hypothetical protein
VLEDTVGGDNGEEHEMDVEKSDEEDSRSDNGGGGNHGGSRR